MQNFIKRRSNTLNSDFLPDNLSTLIKNILVNRGLTSASDIDLSSNNLLSYELLLGIDDGVDLLVSAIQNQDKILVVGDFDADGATSTALACMALREMGYDNIDYLVPDRFKMGYGLSPQLVELACEDKPDIILTVDNGISSIEGIALAQANGIKVIVTDHHLPGDQIPAADAIINPNQPGCSFPSKSACGCTVLFYLMAALRARLISLGWLNESTALNLADYLDLVALATIADVVSLDHNNRILVHQGLARIRAGRCQPGISAILDVAGKQAHKMTGADLGFAIAPRLNAAGRMDDMSRGIECLMSKDKASARALSVELEQLNIQRKDVEADMQFQALSWLSQFREPDKGDELPWGLCLYDKDWHEGVIGILASRIKERTHRPVIAFARSGTDLVKGSARSIQGFHMRDALDLVAKRQPGMLTKFGGHAMAAGLTLNESDLAGFMVAFDTVVREKLTQDDLNSIIWSDGELVTEDITIDTALAIRDAGPWGQNFPHPTFDGIFDIIQQRIVGQKHLKLVLGLENGRKLFDAIAFNVDLDIWPTQMNKIELSYQLDINEFRGATRLQLLANYIEPISQPV